MKKIIVLLVITVCALYSVAVLAEDAGDQNGDVIDNPWIHLFTTTATTTAEPTTEVPETTTEEPSTVEPTAEPTVEPTTDSRLSISIDGSVIAFVEPGDSYTLPDTDVLGFDMNQELYRPGTEIENITTNLAFTTIEDDLNLQCSAGASIKLDGQTGIAFHAIANNEIAVKPYVKLGTLITPGDMYTQLYFNDFTVDSESLYGGRVINVPNQGWYNNQEGHFRAGILNIGEANVIRPFIAKAYGYVEYQDGTESELRYSGVSNMRSIKEVAINIKNDDEYYDSLSSDERARVDAFAEAE